MSENKPDSKSNAWHAQAPYWQLVDALLGGVEAMRLGGEKYLPKFPMEAAESYEFRRRTARYTNLFSDVTGGLAAKPFRKTVKLKDGTASPKIAALAEDIDGRGHNLHTVAADCFLNALAYSHTWLLVEYPRVEPLPGGRPRSVAEEAALGDRPYWVTIPAQAMLAVRSDCIHGEEIFVHARWAEDVVVIAEDGYTEKTLKRVRVLNRAPVLGAGGRVTGYEPATFALYELQKNAVGGREDWVEIDSGQISLGIIPLVCIALGRRKAGWVIEPPLLGVVDLAVQHYRAENGLLHATTMCSFPMLAGQGVSPILEGGKPKAIATGPGKVLYSPPTSDSGQHGVWEFIEPAATSLQHLSAELDKIEHRLRQLGRQPLVEGGLTRIEAGLHASAANSAIQSWALTLKDALEQALRFTALWLADASQPEVEIATEYDIDALGATDLDQLIALRKSSPEGQADISRRTLWGELKRRGALSPTFSPAAEEIALDDEGQLHFPDDESLLAAGAVPIRPRGAA
jgi:hypothetical protein